jgi:hypothetical protein
VANQNQDLAVARILADPNLDTNAKQAALAQMITPIPNYNPNQSSPTEYIPNYNPAQPSQFVPLGLTAPSRGALAQNVPLPAANPNYEEGISIEPISRGPMPPPLPPTNYEEGIGISHEPPSLLTPAETLPLSPSTYSNLQAGLAPPRYNSLGQRLPDKPAGPVAMSQQTTQPEYNQQTGKWDVPAGATVDPVTGEWKIPTTPTVPTVPTTAGTITTIPKPTGTAATSAGPTPQQLLDQAATMAGGGGGKGGMVMTGTGKMEPASQLTEQAIYTAPTQAALAGASEDQIVAARALTDAQYAQAQATARAHAEITAQQNERDRQYLAWEQHAHAKLQERQDLADQMGARVMQQADIDPNHWWNSKSTGDQIMTSIAVGLGAFATTMGAKGAYTLDNVNEAINRDVAVQKANYENKKTGADVANNLYALGMQSFNNEQQAELFARQMSYEMAAREAQRFTDVAATATQKAQGDAMVAALRQEIAAKNAEANKKVLKETLRVSPKQMVAAGPGADKLIDRALKLQKLYGGGAKAPSALGKRLQVRVHEEMGANNRAINALSAIEELNRNPAAFAPTEAQGRAEAASAALEEAGIKNPPNAASLLSGKQQGLVEGYRAQLLQKRKTLTEAWDIAHGPEGPGVAVEAGSETESEGQ